MYIYKCTNTSNDTHTHVGLTKDSTLCACTKWLSFYGGRTAGGAVAFLPYAMGGSFLVWPQKHAICQPKLAAWLAQVKSALHLHII